VARGGGPHDVAVGKSDGVSGRSRGGDAAGIPVTLASVVTVDHLANSVPGAWAHGAASDAACWDVRLPVTVTVGDRVHATDASGNASSVVPSVSSPVGADRTSGCASAAAYDATSSLGTTQVPWVDAVLGVSVGVSDGVAACAHDALHNTSIPAATASPVAHDLLVPPEASALGPPESSDTGSTDTGLGITIVVVDAVRGSTSTARPGGDTACVVAATSTVVDGYSVTDAVVPGAASTGANTAGSDAPLGVTIIVVYGVCACSSRSAYSGDAGVVPPATVLPVSADRLATSVSASGLRGYASAPVAPSPSGVSVSSNRGSRGDCAPRVTSEADASVGTSGVASGSRGKSVVARWATGTHVTAASA